LIKESKRRKEVTSKWKGISPEVKGFCRRNNVAGLGMTSIAREVAQFMAIHGEGEGVLSRPKKKRKKKK
jgi:hypothetical protein